ncbi:hypothetical protein ACIQPP_37565 [Streptomyces violaceusniger]|uniref:hypothetical protein n=1 Tax=Streptomyces violaceusniger TaxID=68280 RepID=UPI0009C30948|nr:hypothetical protein [Streptomyces hygroscopicus]AQW47665.1 hypothetical protein SHXM_01128 [Streptomyces hygroscopicus]
MSYSNELESSYRDLIGQLTRNEKLNAANVTYGEPSLSFRNLQDLSHFNSDWGEVELDGRMIDEALSLTSVSAYWESSDPLPGICGEFYMPSPVEILGMGPDPAAEMMEDSFHREFVSQLRPFDMAQVSTPRYMSSIRMTPGRESLEVWFHDLTIMETPPYPVAYTKLDLAFVEYQEAVLLTKGLRGWQYLFADVSLADPGLSDIGESLEQGFEVLRAIFPDDDFSPLIERLEARL